MLTSAHRAASDGGQSTPAGFSGAAELGGLGRPAAPGRAAARPSSPARARAGHATPVARRRPTESTGGSPRSRRSTSPPRKPCRTRPPTRAARARKIQAVKDFYAAIAQNSAGALALLSPSLADGAAGELVRTWSSMDAIDVQEADTQIKPDGSILAVATLHRPDGALVRVTQLFRVADTGGLITEAELVSAQYM